jgi:hypothetical protein
MGEGRMGVNGWIPKGITSKHTTEVSGSQ